MSKTLKNLINDIRISTKSGLRTVTVDKAKAPEVYDSIVNDEVTLIDSVLLVLVDGDDSEVIVCNKGITYSEAVKVSGDGGEPEPVEVSWDDVQDKPETFPPTIGTTATTAKAGDYVPEWSEVIGKPTTFAPSAHQHDASDINEGTLDIARIPTGTTSSTVSLGNHTHAFSDITGTATEAQIPNLDASKITTGTFNIARVNTVLGGYVIGTAGAVADTDTLLEALGKLEARIEALETA